MKITIIGSGNVATVLGNKLVKAGHKIIRVIGRNERSSRELALKLGSGYSTSFEEIPRKSELCIVAISDNALEQLEDLVPFQQMFVVHTSGSVSKDVLKSCSSNYGVMYPLQSLRKEIPDVPQIPFLVDANSEMFKEKLADLCHSISDQVQFADDETRLKMHIAAVIVNNFSNHLYLLAEQYCKSEGVDFQYLLPLAAETVRRLQDFLPQQMQTGPAFRGDSNTIERHLKQLKNYPEIKIIYEQMTRSIGRER